MDERIGYYEGERRVLPKWTLSGAPVTLPVLTTISLGAGYFAVLDMYTPRYFDVEVEANALRKSIGSPVQPVSSEVATQPAPRFTGRLSQDVPGLNTDPSNVPAPRNEGRLIEDARVIDVGEPFQSAPAPDVYGSFSQDVPGDSGTNISDSDVSSSGTKGRK